MTFDTACSASAVAIHTACRDILSGECTAALAGVAVMTNCLWFQNLTGASFLSPTGQCKPFEDGADGYCRAEGIACVFLKKMGDVLRDGDPILGCISSTAVYRNQNCMPLFVPNSPPCLSSSGMWSKRLAFARRMSLSWRLMVPEPPWVIQQSTRASEWPWLVQKCGRSHCPLER